MDFRAYLISQGATTEQVDKFIDWHKFIEIFLN